MFGPTALAMALAAAASADFRPPRLPATLGFTGSGEVCGSQELVDHLRGRFFRVVDADQRADLYASCVLRDGELKLSFYDARKNGLSALGVEREPNTPVGATAFLAATDAQRDKKVVAAALDAFVVANADLADAGSQDFASGNWQSAAIHLARGLETELNHAPLYFGLYRSHAELAHPAQAKWFLAAFLKESGTSASSLSDEQAAPLLRAQASRGAGPDVEARYRDYERLAREERWDAAYDALRELIADAPWYEPAYRSLAESYKKLGWKRLQKIWERRLDFVKRLNKDRKLGRAIEARLRALP